jgi:hypothetical protein
MNSNLLLTFTDGLSPLYAFFVVGETGYLAEKTGGGWWKVALDSGSSTTQEVEVSLFNMLQKVSLFLFAADSNS